MTTRPKPTPSAMDRQELERVPLSEVRFHPDNKRRGDVPFIVESIRTSGWFGACGRQKSTGLFIWGNHRAEAAQEAAALIAKAQAGAWVGIDEDEQELIDSWRTWPERFGQLDSVDTFTLDVDDEEALDILLKENAANDAATYDRPGLGQLLKSIEERRGTLAGTGYERRDLSALLREARDAQKPKEEVETPELPQTPITEPGDVWEVGPHRVMCGDSFSAEARARLLEGVTVGLVITDPPFAIYGSSSGISANIADDRMVRPFFHGLCRALAESVPVFCHVYIHCDWRSYSTLWESSRDSGLAPKNCLVWDKGASGLGSMWANTHEFVAFFVREPETKAMTSGAPSGHRQVHHSNVLRYDRPRGDDREHNAAKPVPMLAEICELASDPGAVVLDLFGGSGSTLIAAARTERRGFTMEEKPGWCDVILARAQRATGHVPTRNGEAVDFLAPRG